MSSYAPSWRALAATALACIAGAAIAADVTLKSAWMRPAAARAPAARVYVDIESVVPLELVGASTAAAASVALVHVRRLDDPASEEVVSSMRVAAGAVTRLAYRGDHLRLIDVKQDLANGTPVPLTLVCRDAQGRQTRASTEVTVRGLLLPQHAEGEVSGTPAAPTPAADGGAVPAAPAGMERR